VVAGVLLLLQDVERLGDHGRAPLPTGTAAAVIITSLAHHVIEETPVGPNTVSAPGHA
jgi:hypothetical protein